MSQEGTDPGRMKALTRVVAQGWLGGEHPGAFAVVHDDLSRAAPPASAVVLVPPFGWDDVASHRARLIWADELARGGHAVVRIDLPATGDSAGDADAPELLSRWTRAVDAAVAVAASRRDRVAVIGLGLGGLVAALSASEATAIDDLVLWGVPARGRALVRQLRAGAALQRSRIGMDEDDVPEGWLESGGFLLSEATIAALSAVDLGTAAFPAVARSLVLGREEAPPDRILVAALAAAGVTVEAAAGPGYEAMVEHPERTTPPEATMERAARWLAGPSAPVVRGGSAPSSALHPSLELDAGVTESVERLQPGDETLVGVRTSVGATSDVGLLLLNAGAVRRTGPNRLWVRFAREAARHGVPSLRLDLPGIGDADGDPSAFRELGAFYEVDRVPVVSAALDRLQEDTGIRRFVVCGLCSGGFQAFEGARRDPRVRGVVLLNPGALTWDRELPAQLQARKVMRLRSASIRRRLLRGDISIAAVRRTLAALAAVVLRRVRGRNVAVGAVAQALDELRAERTDVVLAFSGDEALEATLRADGTLGQAANGRWPDLTLARLPGMDHSLRPLPAQHAAAALVAAAVERVGVTQPGAG